MPYKIKNFGVFHRLFLEPQGVSENHQKVTKIGRLRELGENNTQISPAPLPSTNFSGANNYILFILDKTGPSKKSIAGLPNNTYLSELSPGVKQTAPAHSFPFREPNECLFPRLLVRK
jgi:hypothetical protein